MSKSICYYTDGLIDEPIKSVVQKHLSKAGLFIVSASLTPTDFGDIITVFEEKRSYPTMVKQIISCLSLSQARYVFMAEHDCLYPKSHFDFTPPRDDIFYYNYNCYRWMFGTDFAIRHDRMLSQSCLCVNREFALDHYKRRLEFIRSKGWDADTKGEPAWARKMGYEPGQKKKKRGGFSDDNFDTWESKIPVIDIRHRGTFSSPKTKLSAFKHAPKWFESITIGMIDGWNLKEMFNL